MVVAVALRTGAESQAPHLCVGDHRGWVLWRTAGLVTSVLDETGRLGGQEEKRGRARLPPTRPWPLAPP